MVITFQSCAHLHGYQLTVLQLGCPIALITNPSADLAKIRKGLTEVLEFLCNARDRLLLLLSPANRLQACSNFHWFSLILLLISSKIRGLNCRISHYQTYDSIHGLSPKHCPDSAGAGGLIDVTMELIDRITGSALFTNARPN